jgi:SH3 domain-containing YSC84-like protein 1
MEETSMKKLVSICALVAIVASVALAADTRTQELDRINSAQNVLTDIMAAPDKGIPAQVMASADCVAVVPSMMKGGFIFGAQYGKGIATCRHGDSWSAPAPLKIEGGSWGLQIGGQAVDLVMLVMNQKGMDHLLQSKFKIGADVSGAAGPVGREAAASTDWKMRAEVLTYSRARGAFAGITLNGAAITQDKDDTELLYGKMIPFAHLLSGSVPPPQGSQAFLAEVAKYYRQAKAEETSSTASQPSTPRSGGTTGASGEAPTTVNSAQRQTGTVGSNASQQSPPSK